MNNVYFYDGPVIQYRTCICYKWKAFTSAPSPEKAKSNLTYRFKKEHGYTRNAKINLPGDIKCYEDTKKYDGEQLSFL